MLRMVVRAAVAFLIIMPVIGGRSHADQFVSDSSARGTAQAGALTARAPDTSALTYNPAALAQLRGLQVEVGAGFDVSDDSSVLPPSLYVSWRPRSRWAIGVALDRPVAYRQDQPVSSSSGPFTTDLDVSVLQVHPVAAFAIAPRWSAGAGVRYLRAQVRDFYETLLDSGRNPNTFFTRARRVAELRASTWAADASLSFRDEAWGFGAVLSSGATLNGVADIDITVQQFGLPGAPRAAASLAYLTAARRDLGVDLAPEIRGGVWTRPHRAVTVETDVALVRWSAAEWLRPRESPLCGQPCSSLLPRDWRDTVSMRVGSEAALSRRVQLAGGLAYESAAESQPVRLPTGLTASQRGSWTYGFGATFNVALLSVDAGYSIERSNAALLAGRDAVGKQSSSRRRLAVSTRWRF